MLGHDCRRVSFFSYRLDKELKRLRAEAGEQKDELVNHRREMKKIKKTEAEWAKIRKLKNDYVRNDN